MRKVKPRAGWLDRYSYEESITILSELAQVHLAKAADIAAASHNDLREELEAGVEFISRCISDRDWTPLLNYELAYNSRVCADYYIHTRQALGFFVKFEALRTGIDKESVALEKFVASEEACLLTNWRLRNCWQSTDYADLVSVLALASEKCCSILGPVPVYEALHFRFGPGSTHNVKKSQANPRVKLGAKYECSHELAEDPSFLGDFLAEFPELAKIHGLFPEVNVVPGRLEFVPKNAKTYRSIIVEPGLNVLYQQGIGQEIRRRFKKKTHIDLNDDSRQHRLAHAASVCSPSAPELATIDFSAASDHISTELVAWLLGHNLPNSSGWFELLAHGRTGSVTYASQTGEKSFELEKFSSMGNSFTWELESLIFYSLAWAICKTAGLPTDSIGVFGDDLILPSGAKVLAEDVFAFCGLPLNHTKSYWSGPFRETCGKDFFLGIDIRPYYQRDMVTAETLFSLHNFYMRNAEPEMARLVRLYIHPNLKLFGPDGYGDGHLIGAWVPRNLRKEERGRGWEGHRFLTYRHSRKTLPRGLVLPGDRILPSYSIYVRGGLHLQEAPNMAQSPPREAEFQDERRSKDGELKSPPLDFRNPVHLVVPGDVGYERISIYTLRRGIFI